MATAISLALDDDDVIFAHDNANVPYGTKTEEELYQLALPKLKSLEDGGCQVIVIACNTLSTTIIDQLQDDISVPLIGVEPMIQEACEATSSNVIAICATPRTLKSERYGELCREFAGGISIVEPDCSEWAQMIESDTVDRIRIKMTIEDALEQGADVIVLGCTHYHWIESLIKSIVGIRARVIQPESIIVERVRQELLQLA